MSTVDLDAMMSLQAPKGGDPCEPFTDASLYPGERWFIALGKDALLAVRLDNAPPPTRTFALPPRLDGPDPMRIHLDMAIVARPVDVELAPLLAWLWAESGDEGERRVWLGEVLVDPAVVVRYLEPVKAERAEVHLRGPRDPALFQGDGWRVLVMPCIADAEDRGAPRCPMLLDGPCR